MDEEDQIINGEKLDVDKLLRSLKDVGKFQIRQKLILLLNWISQGMNILLIVFIGFIPDYQCRPYTNSSEWPEDIHQMMKSNERNITLEYGECHVTVLQNGESSNNMSFPCTNGYLYSQPAELSFISEWDLVCDRAAVGALSQTLLTIGMGVGAGVIPNFADRFGRKPVLLICLLGLWSSSLSLGFSPSYTVFMVLRFLVGVFQQGLGIPNMTLSLELFPTEYRAFVSMLCGMGWCVGCLMLTPFAYFLQHHKWRHLAILISCAGSILFFDILFLEESLRWLFAKNRVSQAKEIVRRAAKINGVNFEEVWRTCVLESSVELNSMKPNHHPQSQQPHTDDSNEKNAFPPPPSAITNAKDEKKPELFDSKPLLAAVIAGSRKISISIIPESALNLLTTGVLRFIMSIQMYTWFINALTYYGLYLTSSSLAGNRFLNFFLIALSETLSVVVMWKAFVLIGRKKTLVAFLTIATCSLLTSTAASILIDKNSKFSIISTVAAMIGMFGISGSFNGLWGYLPELIPTNYRSAALGMASSTARIGSALSPFTVFLVRYIAWGPGVIFSAGCLLANFLIMMLPETRGRQLPQNIADVKSWMKKPSKRVAKTSSYSKVKQQESV